MKFGIDWTRGFRGEDLIKSVNDDDDDNNDHDDNDGGRRSMAIL